MRILPFLPGLLMASQLVFGAGPSGAAGLPPDALVGDSFTVDPGHRDAGSALIGQSDEIGGKIWSGVGRAIVSAESVITVANTDPAMGLLELTKPGAPMSLSADLKPKGPGFVALAFLPNRSPAEFWNTAAVWVLISSSGDYEIHARGMGQLLKKGSGDEYGFKPGDFNHVELLCNPLSATVCVKINGTTLLAKTMLADLPPLVCAAFRFNENASPNEAKIDNFAVQPASF